MIKRFRNTYTVPAGKIVEVDTPSGMKKFTGGQFVPPELLNKMRTRDADSKGDSSNNSGQKENEVAGPNWDEISNNFKMLDISNPSLVNQGIFNVRQFNLVPIDSSSKKIHPVCKFGAEFSIANLINSVTGFKSLLQNIGLQIKLIHNDDENLKSENIVGKNFIRIGQLDFKNNQLSFWQHNSKYIDLIKAVSEFLINKIGILSFKFLLMQKKGMDDQVKDIDNKIQTSTTMLKNAVNEYASRNKGKPPKPGQNTNIDTLNQNLQELVDEKQSIMQLSTIINNIMQATAKEGGITNKINTHIKEDPENGTIEQFAKVLQHANDFSLGLNKNFDMGLQNIAASHPETATAIKQLLDYLTELQQKQESAQEGEQKNG